MTTATPTPDARKILANLRNHGPSTTGEMGSLFCRRPAEGAPRTEAWSDALVRAHVALSELEQAGRVVRVRTRRSVWFMVSDDAAALIGEAQEALGYITESSPASLADPSPAAS